MDALTAIFTRRSIRAYTGEPVSQAQIDTILRAAMAAPSAGNARPWQFIVVRDRQMLDRLGLIHQYVKMVPKAQVAILVLGDETREKFKGYWVQDCAAAAQNLLLAVHALGLGAVWTGLYPVLERVEAVRKMFCLPEGVTPLALIPIGHPAEDKPAVDRFDAAQVHLERWGAHQP